MNEPINFNVYHPKPLLIVISGPSGAGKDAVLKEMQKRKMPFHFVVTVTDRKKREGEDIGHGRHMLPHQRVKQIVIIGATEEVLAVVAAAVEVVETPGSQRIIVAHVGPNRRRSVDSIRPARFLAFPKSPRAMDG